MHRLCTLRYWLVSLSALFILLVLPASAFAMGHGGGGGGRGGGGGGGGDGGGGGGYGGGYGGGGPGGGGGGPGGGGGGPGGGGGNGGGGGGGHNHDNSDAPQMKWYDSLDAASTWSSSKNSAPVLAVVYRTDNASDKQALDLMSSWPQAIKLSSSEMAAVKISAESEKGKALIAQLGIKVFPFIVWLDPNGNAIAGLQYPFTAVDLSNIVTGWKVTLESVNKYLKERVARGENLLSKGKLREAYFEFAAVTPFKGPEADAAKAGEAKVHEAFTKLIDAARQAAPKSPGRNAIVKGLRGDITGLPFAAEIEKSITLLDTPAADNAAVAQADQPQPQPAADAAKEPAKPAAIVEIKPLKQLASAPLPAAAAPEHDVDEPGLDARILSDSTDKRLKTAFGAFQSGMDLYKRAFAEGTQRGEERNSMLKNARDFFEMTLKMIDEATGGKPDAQMDKLESRISMLVYGCLKYQTL